MVIDYLWDDIKSLRNRSLACKSLLRITRYHIFHSVYLLRRPGNAMSRHLGSHQDVGT